MKNLTREAIENCNDLELSKVEVPEWGGCVYVRPLSAAALDKVTQEYEKVADREKLTVSIIACVCDENGNSLFAEKDTEMLLSKSMKVLMRLAKECNRVNGLDAEEIEKNLETIQ